MSEWWIDESFPPPDEENYAPNPRVTYNQGGIVTNVDLGPLLHTSLNSGETITINTSWTL